MSGLASQFMSLVSDCSEVIDFMRTLWDSFPDAYRVIVLAFLTGSITVGMIKMILF